MIRYLLLIFAVIGILVEAQAQESLQELIQISTENYPELLAKKMETEAAKRQVSYEKSDFVPRMTASYQANYATSNNITGMFLPGQVLPISGPPSLDNSYDMVTGSAAALLLNWSPFTFGKRSSTVQMAKAGEILAEKEEAATVFEHQIRFIHAYLDFWEASSKQTAAEKEVERNNFNLLLSKTLVANGLRPAVDSAQLRTLQSKARINLLHAKNLTQAKAALVEELLGKDSWTPSIDPVLERHIQSVPRAESSFHPILAIYEQQTILSQAEKGRIAKNILPDFLLWGTGFARGSAVDFFGNYGPTSEGMNFSRYNYGLGFQLSMPLFEFAQNKHLVRRQEFRIAAAQAYELQAERQLDREATVAAATLENALEAAKLSPSYVTNASFAYEAIRTRYDAGLINLSELLQGQADLAAAEAEDIQLRSELWKAILYQAAVSGNLDLFMQLLN